MTGTSTARLADAPEPFWRRVVRSGAEVGLLAAELGFFAVACAVVGRWSDAAVGAGAAVVLVAPRSTVQIVVTRTA
jgi:hypothetical protein